jgi:hypothetical protein
MCKTIDEEYFEQIKDELTPLGMSGLYEDKDGYLVSVESVDGESNTTEKKNRPSKTSLQQEKSARANPAYWFQFYDPRYCSESCEEYCKKMAAKYS